MTDQELAQEVQRRLLAAEAAAAADVAAFTGHKRAAARRRHTALVRAHMRLEQAWAALEPAMGLQPLSGGTPKPPRPE
jgi:hypothetical protein